MPRQIMEGHVRFSNGRVISPLTFLLISDEISGSIVESVHGIWHQYLLSLRVTMIDQWRQAMLPVIDQSALATISYAHVKMNVIPVTGIVLFILHTCTPQRYPHQILHTSFTRRSISWSYVPVKFCEYPSLKEFCLIGSIIHRFLNLRNVSVHQFLYCNHSMCGCASTILILLQNFCCCSALVFLLEVELRMRVWF